MEKFKAKETELGFTLLSINIRPMLGKAMEVVKEKGATFPVLMDDNRFARDSLFVVATPTTIVVDENGRIRSRFIGTVGDFEKVVAPILKRI